MSARLLAAEMDSDRLNQQRGMDEDEKKLACKLDINSASDAIADSFRKKSS
jgi:hypothetical protein